MIIEVGTLESNIVQVGLNSFDGTENLLNNSLKTCWS